MSTESAKVDKDQLKNAGGTPGGVVEFLVGLAMAGGGAYMLTQRVSVTTGYWHFWGPNSFGLTLIPLLAGIGVLFFNGSSKLGWMLTTLGTIIIMAGILLNLNIYMGRTSLFEIIMMMGLFFGGLGLIAKGVRAHS